MWPELSADEEQEKLNEELDELREELEKLEEMNEELENPNAMMESEEKEDSIEQEMQETRVHLNHWGFWNCFFD